MSGRLRPEPGTALRPADGLKLFLAGYAVSGVFFFLGAYVEAMFLLGASFR